MQFRESGIPPHVVFEVLSPESQRAAAESQRADTATQRAAESADRAERLAAALRAQGIDPDSF